MEKVQVGYSLIDSNNNEVQFWGNSPKEFRSIPDVVIINDQYSVCAPKENVDYFDHKIVPRFIYYNPKLYAQKSNEIIECDGEKVAVTYQYRMPFEQEYAMAIQKMIDDVAKSKQYNDANSLTSYKDSTVSQWSNEATTFIAWRDSVWTYAFNELEKVKNNERQQPTIEEFLQELPTIVW